MDMHKKSPRAHLKLIHLSSLNGTIKIPIILPLIVHFIGLIKRASLNNISFFCQLVCMTKVKAESGSIKVKWY